MTQPATLDVIHHLIRSCQQPRELMHWCGKIANDDQATLQESFVCGSHASPAAARRRVGRTTRSVLFCVFLNALPPRGFARPRLPGVQSFDQLHLACMVSRVAGDAQHEIESLGVLHRRLPLTGVRDDGGQLLLFGLDYRKDLRPR